MKERWKSTKYWTIFPSSSMRVHNSWLITSTRETKIRNLSYNASSVLRTMKDSKRSTRLIAILYKELLTDEPKSSWIKQL
jgi:hypothetical protein